MHRAITGTAAATIAFSAAWCPVVHVPTVRGDGAVKDAREDRASPDLLSAAEAALWERLREQGQPDELDAFLVLFPQSRFAPEVRRRRGELAAATQQQRRLEDVRLHPTRRGSPPLVDLSAAAGAAAVAPECGLLASAADGTSVTLAGVLRRGQEALVQGMLDAFGVPADAVRLRLGRFEGPYCGALSALRMDSSTPPPDSPPRVALLDPLPLPDGERLRLRVEMPEWPAHLNVFFLTVSGEVVPLVSDARPRPAGTSVMLENPRWRIAAPFGTDLLLVVVSETPLFDRDRPAAERLDDFTPALAAALRRARRTAARVAARAVVVETAPR